MSAVRRAVRADRGKRTAGRRRSPRGTEPGDLQRQRIGARRAVVAPRRAVEDPPIAKRLVAVEAASSRHTPHVQGQASETGQRDRRRAGLGPIRERSDALEAVQLRRLHLERQQLQSCCRWWSVRAGWFGPNARAFMTRMRAVLAATGMQTWYGSRRARALHGVRSCVCCVPLRCSHSTMRV